MRKGNEEKNGVVVNFKEIGVRSGNFVFGFTIEEKGCEYECIYKKDLKGIAAEKWIIDGKIVKVGISKGIKLLGLDEKVEEEILKKRLIMLRNIRGDESKKEKIEFEIVEMESKIKEYEEKIEKMKVKIEDKKKEKTQCEENEKESEKFDVKELIKRSKEEEIERLTNELKKLKGE